MLGPVGNDAAVCGYLAGPWFSFLWADAQKWNCLLKHRSSRPVLHFRKPIWGSLWRKGDAGGRASRVDRGLSEAQERGYRECRIGGLF